MSDVKGARVLEAGAAFPIVHKEGRHFPGLLVQGDTWSIWVQTLRKVYEQTHNDELEDLLRDLEGGIDVYVEVLQREGMRLPFSWPLGQ
jgi:predicted RNase H-like HicB family nuclease